MRILLVTNNYFPLKGGVARSVDLLFRSLKKHGHDVYLVTLQFESLHADEEGIIRIPSLHGSFNGFRFAIPSRAYSFLKKITQNFLPHIIHVHHPFLLGKTAQSIAHEFHIPIVFTYHTQYHLYNHYIPLPPRLVQKNIHKRVLTFCNTISSIIAPTASIKNELLSRGVTAPIKIIPTAIESFFFHQKKEFEPSKNKINLISVSRFVHEKNIPFLLRAVSLLQKKDFAFHLIGYGYLQKRLEHYAFNTLQLPRNKIFFMQQTRAQLLQSYRTADLFVFASHTETQALVLAEAMACGVPVIALDAPGACDIVIHGWNGFLVHSEQEMAVYIQKCIVDKELMQFLSKNARITALQYTARNFAQKTIDWYQELLS